MSEISDLKIVNNFLDCLTEDLDSFILKVFFKDGTFARLTSSRDLLSEEQKKVCSILFGEDNNFMAFNTDKNIWFNYDVSTVDWYERKRLSKCVINI